MLSLADLAIAGSMRCQARIVGPGQLLTASAPPTEAAAPTKSVTIRVSRDISVTPRYHGDVDIRSGAEAGRSLLGLP
jgi:hypothetical protein